jgi:hypothetical protein
MILIIIPIILLLILILGLISDKFFDIIYGLVFYKNKSELNKNISDLKKLNLQCFFTKLSDLPQIKKFAYNKLIDVCKDEKIYFFEVSDNIINKNVKDEDKKASGRYTYLEGKTVIEMNQMTEKIISISSSLNINVEIENYFPKILINVNNDSDKYNVMTLAHELGHHFINVR